MTINIKIYLFLISDCGPKMSSALHFIASTNAFVSKHFKEMVDQAAGWRPNISLESCLGHFIFLAAPVYVSKHIHQSHYCKLALVWLAGDCRMAVHCPLINCCSVHRCLKMDGMAALFYLLVVLYWQSFSSSPSPALLGENVCFLNAKYVWS